MQLEILTLRYSPELGVIDDGPLRALARDHELLDLREHFFTVRELPHLLCIVACRRRGEARPRTIKPTVEIAPIEPPPLRGPTAPG